MRRKKKPFYRLRNIMIALALVFAFAVGREIYLAVTAVPGTSVNFGEKIAALIEAGQPPDVPRDSPNAVDILDKAIVIEAEIQADYRARFQLAGGQYPIDYSTLRGPQSAKAYQPGVLEQIQANSLQAIEDLRKTECFKLLAEAAATRRAVRSTPQTGLVIGYLLPSLGKYRNFARLNGSRMYLAHQAGDDAEMAQAYEETLALARISSHGSFLIEYLVGIAIDQLAFNELRNELVERVPSEEVLVRLLAAMDRQQMPPIRQIVEGERLAVLDTIQWTHTDDGRGSGRLITSNLSQLSGMWGGLGGSTGSWLQDAGSWKIMNLGGAAFPSKAANIRKVTQIFDLIEGAMGKPFYQRDNAEATVDALTEALPQRYVLLRMMLPATGKAMQSNDHEVACREGTRAMIAVELYKKRYGTYPATIDELSPRILARPPIDPFTGKGFGYRVLEAGKDPSGRGYLLYSFGADQTDNGGTPAPKIDVDAFRRKVGKGSDFIFNTPRDKPEADPPAPPPDPAPEEPTPAPDAAPQTGPPAQP